MTSLKQSMFDDPNRRLKGSVVKMCRFANFVDKAREMDPSWHTVLLVVLYLGFQTGLVEIGKVVVEMPKLPPAGDSTSDGRTPVPRGNDQLTQFRDNAKHNVRLVANLMLDPHTRVYCRILWTLCMPIRTWYGRQSVRLRSAQAMAEWVQEQVSGGLNTPLKETWALLSDVSILEMLGLDLRVDDVVKQVTLLHPALASQDRVASMSGEHTRHLIGSRAKRMLYMTVGLAGQQALFVDPDEGRRERAARDLLSLRDAVHSAETRAEPFRKKMCSRCIVKQVPYEQLLKLLDQNGGKPSTATFDHCTHRLRGIGQSKVSEDSNGIGRRMEAGVSNKTQGTAKSLYINLVERRIVGDLHHYTEPDWKGKTAPKGAEASLPKSVFEPSWRGTPEWIRQLRSSESRVKWFSPSATTMNLPFAEAQLLLPAHSSGQWGEIAQGALLSQCASAPGLALQPPGQSTWYIALSDVVQCA